MINLFKKLFMDLFTNSNWQRKLIVAAIIIPLCAMFYGFIDEVVFDIDSALNNISNVSHGSFPVGSYAVCFLGMAKVPEFLTIVLAYFGSAVVWKFTFEIKPMLVK